MPARRRPPAIVLLVLGSLALIWWSQTTGLVSSNDGSHVALARALARGRTDLGADVGLTLWVDRARRDDRDYSDRPPGTAFAAVPAMLAAIPLDRRWFAYSRERIAAENGDVAAALVVTPASPPFLSTYGSRRQRMPGPTVDLLAIQGTAWLAGIHATFMGLLGALVSNVSLGWLRIEWRPRCFALLALGLGSLWGPYSTALFSHVTAGTCLVACLLGTQMVRGDIPADERLQGWWAAFAGAAGAWTVAADYALLLGVLPLLMLEVPVRRWPWVLLGAMPFVVATLAYHIAAFGSPFRIGYDFQTNFAFARERASTVTGNPWVGLWILWGLGRGAGVLAQCPIMLVGIVGLVTTTYGRRWLLALTPWFILLACHRTPYGGGTEDCRYLVPAFPWFAIGLGIVGNRLVGLRPGVRLAARVGLTVLLFYSAVATWVHFWQWRG